MDRVELGIKLEQINKLRDKGDYEGAAKVTDTIDWRKIKKWSELAVAADVYEKAGRYKDARNICVYAYNRNLGGKRLIYKLTELSIQIEDFDEADDLYSEFVEAAPRDMERYILLYKLNKARKASTDRLIEILEEYKQSELDEQYEYELAELYAQAGRTQDCIRECDDLILWFNEGEYVEKALRLKSKYTELSKSQKTKLEMIEEYRAAGMEYSTLMPEYESESDEAQDKEEAPVISQPQPKEEPEEEFKVPEKDYSIYDTQNVQAELAKSMALLLGGINGEESFAPEDANEENKTDIEETNDNSQVVEEEPIETVPEEDAATTEPEDEDSDADSSDEEAVIGQVEALDRERVTTDEPYRETETDSVNEVDEPTKEIRINTHHWNRYRSVMVEDDIDVPSAKAVAAPVVPDALPKFIVEESVMTAETDTEPQFVVEDVETVIGKASDTEPADDIDKVTDVQEPETEERNEILEDKFLLTPAMDEEEQQQGEVSVADFAPEIKAVEKSVVMDDKEIPIAGQIDLMQWLDTVEAESPIEENMEAEDAEPAEEEPEAEETLSEEDAVDAAMNEIAGKLMEEVAAELEEKERRQTPTAIAEEEYVDEESDISDGEEPAEEEDVDDTESIDEEETVDDTEDEDNDYLLKPSERKYLEKYLFISGMEETAAEIVHSKKCEKSDGTSAHGNIVVVGKAKTNKIEFAIDLFKAIHSEDRNNKFRVAKTTASTLNNNSILASADKIKGATLIIENAGQLTKTAAKELCELMTSDTDSMLVILTGEDYAINRVFAETPKLSEMFEYRIEVRRYSVNELVAVAKEYARVKGYVIGEKALLKLYLLIGEIDSGDGAEALDKSKAIIDKAIEHSNRKSRNRSGKKSGNAVQLKEKDFI